MLVVRKKKLLFNREITLYYIIMYVDNIGSKGFCIQCDEYFLLFKRNCYNRTHSSKVVLNSSEKTPIQQLGLIRDKSLKYWQSFPLNLTQIESTDNFQD